MAFAVPGGPGIPRDRNGRFDPLSTGRFQRRCPGFGGRIPGRYASGRGGREIERHIVEICGFEASPGLIPALTEAVPAEPGGAAGAQDPGLQGQGLALRHRLRIA